MSGMLKYEEYLMITAIQQKNCTVLDERVCEPGLSYTQANGYVLLYEVCSSNSTEIGKYFIIVGYQVNCENSLLTKTLFHYAVSYGYTSLIDIVNSIKAGVVVIDDSKNTPYYAFQNLTPLYIAAQQGNEYIVLLFVAKEAAFDSEEKHGETPRHIAAERGNLQVIECLATRDASVNCFTQPSYNDSDYTNLMYLCNVKEPGWSEKKFAALHLPTIYGKIRIFECILDHGADEKDGKTALKIAIEKSYTSIVELIVLNCPDAYHNSNKKSFSKEMIKYNFGSKFIQSFHNHGFSVDVMNTKLLFNIINMGHTKVLEYMIEYGADVNAIDDDADGYSLLHCAVIIKNKEICELLLRNKAVVNVKDKNDKTPLVYAVTNGDNDIAKLLLNNGGLIEDYIIEAFNTAVQNSYLQVIELILLHHDTNFIVNATDSLGRTPLHCAALVINDNLCYSDYNGIHNVSNDSLLYNADYNSIRNEDVINDNIRSVIAKLLLMKGAIIDSKLNGFTPLFAASKNGFKNVVVTLLEYKANIDVMCNDNSSLHIAASKGHAGVVEILLKSGCNFRFKDNNGRTALHLATEKGHKEVVSVLLEFIYNKHRTGISHNFIDYKDDNGCTAFMIAANKGFKDIVEILFNFGADTNCTDDYGRTALHVALEKVHGELTEMLLKYGCDVNNVAENGRTVIEEYHICSTPICLVRENGVFHPFDVYDTEYRYFAYRDFLARKDVIKIIKNHIRKLLAANLYVCDANLQLVSTDSDCDEYLDENKDCIYRYYSYEKCQEELETMKNHYITNSISYYDIVTKSINQLSIYMRNKVILQAFNSCHYESLFPIYSDIIYCHFKLAIRRNDLLNECERSLLSVNSILSEIPNVCIENVLNNLTDNELKVFIVACGHSQIN